MKFLSLTIMFTFATEGTMILLRWIISPFIGDA